MTGTSEGIGGGTSERRLARLWYMGNNTAEIARKVGLPEHEVDRRMALARRSYPRGTVRRPRGRTRDG